MVAKNITRLEKELARKRLAIVKRDLDKIGRARRTLTSARARRVSRTNILINQLNLKSINLEKQRLNIKRKEFEDLLKLKVSNGEIIPTSPTTTIIPLRKSFLETNKAKIIKRLSQSKRPFFSGRRIR